MLLLDPKLVILDEIDSGLDIDAIKIICEGIVNNLSKDSALVVLITPNFNIFKTNPCSYYD
jgi:Fe-S cluster assembly ATP-binding protein